VIVGGLLTYGAQLAARRQERTEKRRVAARLFYGDLAVTEAICGVILETKTWPDRLDFTRALSTWVEYRSAFAAGLTALEWTHVGAFYSNLERTALMIRHSEPCSEGDLKAVANLKELATKATLTAAEHTAKRDKEMEEVVKELGGGKSGG
jgi:hypothetical protein